MLGNIMVLQAKQRDDRDRERNAPGPCVRPPNAPRDLQREGDMLGNSMVLQAKQRDDRDVERNAPGPCVRPPTAKRDLQREGDMLRWRILHYQHSFAHIQAEAALPVMVTGTAIADANAEELRRARTFVHWRDTINMHSLRSDF